MRKTYSSDDDFLAKCRNIDFSADSQKYEENLEALKGKLTQANEGRHIMKKSRKFSIAIAAVLVALLIPVAAFAAAPAIWEYLTITIVRSNGDAVAVTFDVAFDPNDINIEDLGDGTFAIQITADINSLTLSAMDDEQVTLHIMEGAQIVQLEVQHFYDLDEALNQLEAENPLLPAYLPEGFVFERAMLPINPTEGIGHRNLSIFYSDSQNELRFRIFYVPEGFDTISWGPEPVDVDMIGTSVDINGVTGRYINGSITLEIGNILYLLESTYLSKEQLVKIAKSLQ